MESFLVVVLPVVSGVVGWAELLGAKLHDSTALTLQSFAAESAMPDVRTNRNLPARPGASRNFQQGSTLPSLAVV